MRVQLPSQHVETTHYLIAAVDAQLAEMMAKYYFSYFLMTLRPCGPLSRCGSQTFLSPILFYVHALFHFHMLINSCHWPRLEAQHIRRSSAPATKLSTCQAHKHPAPCRTESMAHTLASLQNPHNKCHHQARVSRLSSHVSSGPVHYSRSARNKSEPVVCWCIWWGSWGIVPHLVIFMYLCSFS